MTQRNGGDVGGGVVAKRLLYVAAPYTHPDPVENTHWVGKVAMALYEDTDFLPFVPHLNLAWHLISPRSPQFWYDLDFEYLTHCDALVRLTGRSSGADLEVAYAESVGMEIIDYADLPERARNLWENWSHQCV